MTTVRWKIRPSGSNSWIGEVLASSITVAHALARARFGHSVAVFNRGVVCPPQPRPDPLPEVEYFGPGFYP